MGALNIKVKLHNIKIYNIKSDESLKLIKTII